ncbi:hypothetical protein JCM10213_000613 [Rhodosporidiobolus nylandii]
MSAIYSIFTSPHHPPVPDHLPTLIVTPHGRPQQILYTYLHTNLNSENYLLTPSEAGDLCVAKLFPPDRLGASRSGTSSASHSSGASGNYVRCEASRNLRWHITQSGIANPIYKLTLPNPESPQEDQPLFQVSRPNPNSPWWTIFYFAYAGHLIPPKRIEFGRIQKNPPEAGGGTRVAITGKSDEEKAVWKTLGEGNEDMVEWVVICAALVVLDDEIRTAAGKAGLTPPATGGKLHSGPSPHASPQRQRTAPIQMQGPPPQMQMMGSPRAATAPPHPQQQYPPRGVPPQGYPTPPQQQGYPRPPPPQQYPQQMAPPQGYPHSQPHQSSPLAAGAAINGRQPSSYRPGPGRPQRQDSMPLPGSGGADGGGAARMVQQQVEQRRMMVMQQQQQQQAAMQAHGELMAGRR